MRILLDSCVWGGARDVIAAAGQCSDPGDMEVLRRAHAEQRVLVTLDEDFGELVIVRGLPHAGLVRLVGIRGRDQDLAAAAILTVHPDRVRVRSPGH